MTMTVRTAYGRFFTLCSSRGRTWKISTQGPESISYGGNIFWYLKNTLRSHKIVSLRRTVGRLRCPSIYLTQRMCFQDCKVVQTELPIFDCIDLMACESSHGGVFGTRVKCPNRARATEPSAAVSFRSTAVVTSRSRTHFPGDRHRQGRSRYEGRSRYR